LHLHFIFTGVSGLKNLDTFCRLDFPQLGQVKVAFKFGLTKTIGQPLCGLFSFKSNPSLSLLKFDYEYFFYHFFSSLGISIF
jgi:hypothetical protein